MALRGAQIVENEQNIEGIFIPLNIAGIKQRGSRYDLSFTVIPFKKGYFDYMVVKPIPKEERDGNTRPTILGNASNVKTTSKEIKDRNNSKDQEAY